ncbi:MAG TPA: hypothetical protein VLJ79_20595, partial [Candidatus Binatia bacterium]|nr:hypothetical protein [Candidatus Binatia bacterium]
MMSIQKSRWALPPRGYCSSPILNRPPGQLPSLPCLLGLLLVVSCATATITPTVRAPTGLPKPDRVLVHEFEIANADSELSADLVPPVQRGASGTARREEEVRAGRASAQVLAE